MADIGKRKQKMNNFPITKHSDSQARKKPVQALSTHPKRTIRLAHPTMTTSKHLVNVRPSSTTSISLPVRERRHTDETNAEKISRDILTFCQQQRTHFVDDQFPPIARSIGPIHSLQQHQLKWLRISQINPLYRSDLHLKWFVYSSPKPSDIQQGALGDCWLMVALALITERPKMLEHIVLTKTINNQGVYLIRICHNGLWQTVIVDDCFPCTEFNQLAFGQAHRRQLYVPLIEKACAKLFGSYADLIGGQTEEGLQLLTGAPCEHIDLHPGKICLDKEIIWAKLLSACESHLLIVASTGRSDISDNEYLENYIQNNHAFSVLAACSIPQIAMEFVLIRDPHARSNYRDELLTPATLQQLNQIFHNSQSTGAFWISWPKFLRLFNSITISSYASDYYDIREVNRFTRSSTQLIPTFHFHLSKTSLINISLLYHRSNRRVRYNHTQSFVLCNVEQGASKDVGTTQAILCTSRGVFTHWIGSLTPGFYVIIPFSTSFWSTENLPANDYTLVIHSKVQINVQVTPEPATLLADCLIATVLKSLPPHREKNFNYYVTTTEYSFSLFVAENLSATEFLNFEIDLNDSVRVRNSRNSLSTFNSIPPRHRQILFLIEWTNGEGEKAKMEYVYRSQHVHQAQQSIPEIIFAQNDFHSYRPF